ncbi:MAG TPA: rod shape-determining protein MreC [Bryobacteraceae bacterium]|jgi:rod shape-determining protein MreC|nr:rod shape-determining protein MreC [Bryobacteraceae bacterium]
MESSIFYRYRNIIVLLIVIFAQLILLAWQVRSDSDVPMVRVWAVTAVAPVASAIEGFRNGTTGFFSNYFELRNARTQSRQLKTEVERLRLENQLLKNELGSAQRAEALAGFQAHNPSKMIGARVIGATPGIGTKSVLIDRGAQSGVRRGMAVVTPDGIVGSVIAVFPFDSQVRSVTDPGFAAGVESQINHVHGVLKGLGTSSVRVDFVPTGQKVENGEMFYTSGEDRIFPKGLPVGKVTSVREGSNFQDITVEPSGAESAPEEVLVILDPVHQAIPDAPAADGPVFLAPDVSPGDQAQQTGGAGLTTADKLRDQYKKIGDAQKHVFGEGLPGTLPPNFNLKVPGVNAPAEPAAQAAQPSTATAPSTTAPARKTDTSAKPVAPATSTTAPATPPKPPAPRPAATATSPAPAKEPRP